MIEELEFPQLVGPSYSYASMPIDCQESVNFESLPIQSSSSPYRAMLVSTPGTRKMKFSYNGSVIDSLPSGVVGGKIRGIHVCSTGFGRDTEPSLVVVCGVNVWQVKKPLNGVYPIVKICEITVGPTSDSTFPVSMADCGGESGSEKPPTLLIVDGYHIHSVNMDDYSYSMVGDADAYFRPHRITFLGTVVFGCGNDIDYNRPSGRVYWSEINKPSSFLGYFVTPSVSNDPVLSVNAVGNYLWMVGTDSYEVWQIMSSGATDELPINKVSGSADKIGSVSESSVASIGNNIFFVGSGDVGHGKVYHGEGTRIERISTDAMESELSRYEHPEDCESFCYSEGNNLYYVVNFIYDDATWVYNISSKCWHRRSTFSSDGSERRWKVSGSAYSYSRTIVYGMDECCLYEMSVSYLDDDGLPIVRRRTSPHIVKNGHDARHASFTLDVECGVGLSSGYGTDPQIMLRAYDDAGRTPREERWRPAGKQGAYRTKVKWLRLGHTRDRVYEIKVSAPVKWTIYGARVEVESPGGGR